MKKIIPFGQKSRILASCSLFQVAYYYFSKPMVCLGGSLILCTFCWTGAVYTWLMKFYSPLDNAKPQRKFPDIAIFLEDQNAILVIASPSLLWFK